MSHFFYKYECHNCGYIIDKLSEGGRMFSDENYLQLQCSICKNVESINVAHEKEKNKDFPLSECCHAKMQLWDKTCPACGKTMKETILYDDFG